MFNLELVDISFNDVLSEDIFVGATHVVTNCHDVFILKNGRVFIYDLTSGLNRNFKSSTPLRSVECITQFSLLSIPQKLWFGTGKRFVCISSTAYNLSFVLQQENEFTAAEWNSSQDIIAIVRKDGEIGTYAVDFVAKQLLHLHSIHLDNEDVQHGNVNIGWGSESTQFDHSKVKKNVGAKKANDEEMKVEPEVAEATEDDMKPRLSWKPDASQFAVNYYSNGKRKIKVYLPDCILIYVYENIIGLVPVVVWKPFSTFLICAVHTNKRCAVLLLGKTALDKYYFDLQHNESIEEIKWSSTGSELAIRQRNSEKAATINVYSIFNFQLYLKQCMVFTASNSLITYDFVNVPSQCVLQIATFKELVSYSFKEVVHHNTGAAAKDGVTVAVINGRQLCLSHCAEGALPLPLYNLIINTRNPTNFVAFHPEKSWLATLDCINRVNIYDYDFDGNKYQFIFEYKLPLQDSISIPLRVRNFHWRSDTQIVCFKNESYQKKKIRHIYFLNMHGASNNWKFSSQSSFDEEIHYVSVLKNKDTLLSQNMSTVALFDSERIISKVTLTSVPMHVDAVVVNSNTFVFGLTARNLFMVNELEVHNSIMSFIVHGDYLILLTNDYNLIALRLNSAYLEKLCKSNFDCFYTRPIDNGSRLLFAIPDTSNIITLNGRGNLEVYACRMITIDQTETLIQQGKWNEALYNLRLYKVDFNVIIDLDAKRFLNNVDMFLESVQSQGFINEFLVSLTEDNVFYTLYRDCFIKPPKLLKNKCTTVCKAMIKSMQEYNYIHFIKSITISEIMKSESSITQALHHINYLLKSSTEECSYIDLAETTLQTIQTLKPNLEIYNTALAMYNLELALFVASKIGLDPQVYEPFIKELRSMEELRARFVINNFLKNYRDALPYYIQLASDDEILTYITKHDLAKFAYPLLKHKPVLFLEVLKLMTEKLSTQEKHDEAAAAYLHADLKEHALKEYYLALQWKPVVHLMKQLKVDPQIQSEILTNIVLRLTEKRCIADASSILEEHLQNCEGAIKLLIEHDMFLNAIEIAQKHCRQELIENDIQTAMQEYFKQLNEKMVSEKRTFKKHFKRLLEIRKVKRHTFLKYFNRSHDPNEDPIEDDGGSLAAATVTALSTTTFRTGVSIKSECRRKAERRKEDLREGSPFEDIALIKVLYNLIQECFQYGPLIHKLIVTAIAQRFGITRYMEEAHQGLLYLQQEMSSAIPHIWPPEMNIEQTNPMDATVFVYQNIYELDFKYRTPPTNLDRTWPLSILVASY